MSEQKAIVLMSNMDEIERAATAMSKSGYFQDASQQAQAVVKILAGRELGFGPFASMTGIYIIQGKPSVGANLQAAAVKGSGKYDYKIRELTDKTCRIEFFQGKESIGISEFTFEDAKKAGTKNTEKYPRNMLFARAMSNGVRWFCPDIFNGAPVYTPEELGAEVNQDGEVIAGSFVDHPAPAQPEPVETPIDLEANWKSEKVSYQMASTIKSSDGTLYISLDNKALEGRRIGLNKRIANNHLTPEEVEDTKLRLDVIDGIFQARGEQK